MKRNLKHALGLISKVQTDPRVGPDQGDRLRIAHRELLAIAQSGKLDKPRLTRAIQMIAEVMLEIVRQDAN